MTFVVRKLEHGSNWVDAKLKYADDKVVTLPPWLSLEFTPRFSDKNWLSLFTIASDSAVDATPIAAAMSLSSDPAQNSRQIYACVALSKLQDLGLPVRTSPGGTYHQKADEQHIEVEITNRDQVLSVFATFWQGSTIEIKGKPINERRKHDAQHGIIRFNEALRVEHHLPSHAAHLIKHVKAGDITTIGVV